MRKLFLLGIILTFANVNVEAEQVISEHLNIINVASHSELSKPKCRPNSCPRGAKGIKGSKGARGKRGERGQKGPVSAPFTINDVIEVTTKAVGFTTANTLISFDPIVNVTNGFTVSLPGGLALVESVPSSGNFDTISLPLETRDTFYSVTYGVSLGAQEEDQTPGNFQLVLNGTPLEYTTLSIVPDSFEVTMISQTSVIRNQAGIAGTLSLISLTNNGFLFTNTDIGFTAYMTVIKLNQNP